jgi:hypothetical protein
MSAWKEIDENTPQDRDILVKGPEYGKEETFVSIARKASFLHFVRQERVECFAATVNGTLVYDGTECEIFLMPTHWMEIPE